MKPAVRYVVLGPNSAVPNRSIVAPSSTAMP
jgi:hypothetical protein